MPEGQFTGSKARYIYVSDTGISYTLRRDETLGDIAGVGLTEYDPASPPTSFGGAKPSQLKPRGVYWEGTLGGTLRRKFLICGTTEATLYNSGARQALTIDGVAGFTTGRKGEQFTF